MHREECRVTGHERRVLHVQLGAFVQCVTFTVGGSFDAGSGFREHALTATAAMAAR